jgi:hypothetical protein
LRWAPAGLFAVHRASNTVFFSRDHGRTWRVWPGKKKRWEGSVINVAVNGAKPQSVIVHAFSQGQDGAGGRPVGESLWRSDNGGESFHALPLHADRPITALRFHGNRGCVVFHEGGLFCTDNGGGSWTRWPLGAQSAARDVAVSATGHTVLTDDAVIRLNGAGGRDVLADVDGPRSAVVHPTQPQRLAFTDRTGERIFVLNGAAAPVVTTADEPVRALAAIDFERGWAIIETTSGGWKRARLNTAPHAATH